MPVLLAACRSGPTNAEMERLKQDLASSFPAQIKSVAYENAPPLDPPTLFIDMQPNISTDDELAFLCDLVGPKVNAVNVDIEATTTYGYYLRTDCPKPTGL